MTRYAHFAPARLGRLLAADSMNVSRDPMLLLATVLSIAPAALMLLGRDTLDAAALSSFGVAGFSLYAMPLVLMIPAMLIGWVTGFLFLEDRDDGPLLAIDVTPPGKEGFFAYRAAATALVTGAITLAACRLLLADQGWAFAILMSAMIGFEAVLAAIVLPAIARNKVEGLALTKLVNLASLVPFLAVIPSPWRLVGGLFPSYWVGELLNLSRGEPLPFLFIAIAAVVVHIVWGALLLRLSAGRAG
jgi:fluoroquinolone transport system permease protein